MIKQIVTTFMWYIAISSQAVFAASDSNEVLLDSEQFSKLVMQKDYNKAHYTAVSEAKLVPEELEYLRSNKLVPYDKRHIYLRRPFEYYEVLLATKENQLSQLLEKELFKTLPEKTCVDKMLEIGYRVKNTEAIKRLKLLRTKSK